MLNEGEKKAFFEWLCDELRKHRFGRAYGHHDDLMAEVIEVVQEYRDAKAYGGKIGVYEDKWLIEKLNAFGVECVPDVCIKIHREPFIAIEVKLLQPGDSVRKGIGQAIVNWARYNYGIIFALDKREFKAQKHEFDKKIESSLWKNYRIRLIIKK